jgi:RNA 2',3'-cyclic 3'-phosphodiesterase
VSSPASVGRNERLRLFCALRLPEHVLEAIEAWQHAHLRDGRIVPRHHLHLTLAFLGARPAVELPAIAAALRRAVSGVRDIQFTTRGYRETRSVGMLVLEDQTGEAGRVAARLFDGLEALAVYEREKRPWLAHVTVLRFRSRPRLDPPLPDLGAFSPSDAAVYSSTLRPAGAQYDVLELAPLGG